MENIPLDSPLLECGFCFNQKFRDYFSAVTGINSFKFNADMATAWRKVKSDNNMKFTIQDMIKGCPDVGFIGVAFAKCNPCQNAD